MSTDTDSGSPGTVSEMEYSEVEIERSAGLKPMLVTAGIVIVSWIALTGLPFYWQTGDGELTLFSYTTVLWGGIIIVMGFVYEYWITSLEDEG